MPSERRLYAVTPDETDTARLLARCEAALRGGVTLLQYRNKLAAPELALAQAQALRGLCRQYGADFIINDHLPLALAVDADGLHLGADDGDLAAARAALGPTRWLGASCYNRLELARAAVEAGANYVAFGAVFTSGTKPAAVHAPLALITQARQQLTCPICVIGGITPDNAAQAFAAGADWLAVIGGLFGAADPEQAARHLLAAR